ncbi:MAG: glycosyltransferase [Patescibacteria group bacterium]
MKFEQKISLIICAYNEAKNIRKVLDVVAPLDFIDEKIVVDDCSKDKTCEIVKKYSNVRLLKNKQNGGKGMALYNGIKHSHHPLLLFLDADLIGLTEGHILELLGPVAFMKTADLSLGVFNIDKLTTTKIANRAFPAISGQRVIWRKNLPPLAKIKHSRFGVDALITAAVPKERREIVVLHGLTQVIKEEKNDDIWAGIKSRYKMYEDIVKAIIQIEQAKKKLKRVV